MNTTNKKTIVSIVVLIILIIALTLYWQFFGSNSANKNQSAQVINSQQEEEKEIITALYQYTNGRHTIAGEVNLPTPCHLLNQAVTISSVTAPEQINIDFATTAKDESLCAQVVTSNRYKIDFVASEGAVITATWNGKPAILNLIPVAAGESLDNLDVFIKG